MFNSNSYSSNDIWGAQTNIEYVTSLEEALSRSNLRNSEKVYFHQDKPTFFRIKIDADGRKYWQEFQYDVPKNVVDNTPATKSDLANIAERLQRVEDYVFQDTEGVTNEKSNG